MDFPEMLPSGGVSPPPPNGDADSDPCFYPTGDDQPMSETRDHGTALLSIFFQLEALAVLRSRQSDWYLLRDNFWYFERGDPSKCCAPDIGVITGVTDTVTSRDCWKEWLEGGLRPSVVFEMASRSTVADNLTTKRDLYESLGVEEYFLFDPKGVFLDPRLRGFRLSRGRYRELALDSQGRLESRELGVRLLTEGRECRLYDRATGDRILTRGEADAAAAIREGARADQEAARADEEAAARAEEAAKAARAAAQNEVLRQALRAAGIDPDALPGI